MGAIKSMRQRGAKLVRFWALPLVLSIVMLIGFTSLVRADTPPSSNELANYLQTNTLEIGVDSVDGYQQVFYMYKGSKIYITSAAYNHTNPVASGQYVAWQGVVNGFGQIFRYNVVSQELVQLTSTGTNQNPSIDGNLVLWEHWAGDYWDISYYDGLEVTQLTSGTSSAVRPRTNGRQIIFAQELAPDWKAYTYDLLTKTYTVLHQGDEASTAFPAFGSNGSVTTNFANYKY